MELGLKWSCRRMALHTLHSTTCSPHGSSLHRPIMPPTHEKLFQHHPQQAGTGCSSLAQLEFPGTSWASGTTSTYSQDCALAASSASVLRAGAGKGSVTLASLISQDLDSGTFFLPVLCCFTACIPAPREGGVSNAASAGTPSGSGE